MQTQRLDYQTLSPQAYRGFQETYLALTDCSLAPEFIELIYLRVSQLNGCAFCLDMHASALRQRQVIESKLDCLAGWRVSTRFDARERAALAWVESVTHIAQNGAAE